MDELAVFLSTTSLTYKEDLPGILNLFLLTWYVVHQHECVF